MSAKDDEAMVNVRLTMNRLIVRLSLSDKKEGIGTRE